MKAVFLVALAVSMTVAQDRVAGFRGDVIGQIDFAGGRIMDLAKAIPADKFGWRPAEGVRSVSEVVMHVAGANYYLLGMLGVKGKELAKDYEKETNKDKVLASLKEGMDFAKEAVAKMDESKLDEKIKLFGSMESTRRNGVFILMGHYHEHLGQLIAYARSNGVVPPWSAKEQ